MRQYLIRLYYLPSDDDPLNEFINHMLIPTHVIIHIGNGVLVGVTIYGLLFGWTI
jgi:hypothetical protein